MKHLVKFSLFEEVNPKDISFIQKELDNYFTVSFEFEIETDDKLNIKTKYEDLDEDTVEDVLDSVIKDLKIRKNSEKEFVTGLAYAIHDEIEYGIMTREKFDEIFDIKKCKNDREKEIFEHLRNSIISIIIEEDYRYLKNMVKRHMPNFVRKWNSKIDFVGDATLERGIEIKPKTYLSSISESLEMINDFYNDLENQKYWHFSERTGLHINIGSNKEVKWNPIKGLLILNDFTETDSIPYTFKDMTWRMNNRFCGSLTPHLKSMSDKEKNLLSIVDIHDIEKAEKILNPFISKKVNDVGFKNLGFNITKLSDNYCEFRYAGGDISRDVLIEKVKYFAFVVYCMTNPEYKKREYIKKLYKFINSL